MRCSCAINCYPILITPNMATRSPKKCWLKLQRVYAHNTQNLITFFDGNYSGTPLHFGDRHREGLGRYGLKMGILRQQTRDTMHRL